MRRCCSRGDWTDGTSVCLMGTSAPCDPATPTVYANETSVVLKSIPGCDHVPNATVRLSLFIGTRGSGVVWSIRVFVSR
jgi:hypothetical protein